MNQIHQDESRLTSVRNREMSEIESDFNAFYLEYIKSFSILFTKTNVDLQFYSASPREIPAIRVLIKLTHAGAWKKFGMPILGFAVWLSAAKREIRGFNDETTMIGRKSEQRSLHEDEGAPQEDENSFRASLRRLKP